MKVNVQPGPAVESLPMSKGHLRTWGWQKWIHLCWQSVNHSDKGKRYLQQFWQWVKDTSDNNPYKEWAAHLSNVKVSSCPLWLRVPAKEANSGLRWSLNWWSVWFWLRLVMIEVEWVGVNYGYWINDPHLGTFLWPPTINLRTWLHIRRCYSRENNPSTVTCVQTSSHRQKGSYLVFLFEMFPVASQSASSLKIRMTPTLVCIILLTDLSSGIPAKSPIQISTQAILRKPQDSKSTIDWHRMSERVEQSTTSVAGGGRQRREICEVEE